MAARRRRHSVGEPASPAPNDIHGGHGANFSKGSSSRSTLISSVISAKLPTPTRGRGLIPAQITPVPSSAGGGREFWLVLGALCITVFLSALDTTSFSTMLPTIVSDLKGKEFIWIAISYTMASSSFLPMTGGLAQAFGRKPVLMMALVLYMCGSIACGSAHHMTAMIISRAVQGVGGGAMSSLCEIIISDLVPLNRRGFYSGLVSAVWAVASAVGHPVGGYFSERSWRWLFYMNAPFTLAALTLVYFFLHLKEPQVTISQKLSRMDWIGSLIIIGSSSIFVVALSNSPIFPWGLVPLITASIGFLVFFWYEAKVARYPTVPWCLLTNRTSLSGYISTFFHAISSSAVICKYLHWPQRMSLILYSVVYMPVFFQSSMGKSPSDAGIAVFGSVFSVAPAAIVCGISISASSMYRPQNVAGWIVSLIGFGLLSTLTPHSPVVEWMGYQIITGVGLGFLYSSPKFPVLAPLRLDKTANALAFFSFVRKFSGIWGIAIGSAILNYRLSHLLPHKFIKLLPSMDADIAYAAIPHINELPEPLKSQVRKAFADSLRWIWYSILGVSACGLLTTAIMKEIPMHKETDASWGISPEDNDYSETSSILRKTSTPNRPPQYQVTSWAPNRPLSASTARTPITPLSQHSFPASQIAFPSPPAPPDPFDESSPWSLRKSFHLLDPPKRAKRSESRSGISTPSGSRASSRGPSFDRNCESPKQQHKDPSSDGEPCDGSDRMRNRSGSLPQWKGRPLERPGFIPPSPPPRLASSPLHLRTSPGDCNAQLDQNRWHSIELTIASPTPTTPRRPFRSSGGDKFQVDD